jgi:hypothetical protein
VILVLGLGRAYRVWEVRLVSWARILVNKRQCAEGFLRVVERHQSSVE